MELERPDMKTMVNSKINSLNENFKVSFVKKFRIMLVFFKIFSNL